jgi:hypothetical protein
MKSRDSVADFEWVWSLQVLAFAVLVHDLSSSGKFF